MSSFNPSRVLSFDLETTGVDPTTARIVTSALVRINGAERDDYEMLADPGVEIPERATSVHGISTQYAREYGRPHQEVLDETIERIYAAWQDGAALVVYNAAYDLSVLKALQPSFTIDGLVIDPLVIEKEKNKYRRGKKTLEAVSQHYGVPVANAHEATSDAIAAARVAWKQTRAFPELLKMTSEQLMLSQAQWHYDAQTSLQQYFDQIGKDATVNTSWPLVDAVL